MKAPNKVYVREYQDGDYTTWWDEKPHEEESIGMKAVCYIRKDVLLEKLEKAAASYKKRSDEGELVWQNMCGINEAIDILSKI